LKLKCDILLSTSAFEFDLRRYNEGVAPPPLASVPTVLRASVGAGAVGRCKLTL